MTSKPILVSGVQPTGRLHIGNYLGTLKNFVELQNSGKYECYFFIADLHSLTETYEPKEKSAQILELAADFLAVGLDPKKSVIFQQSQIPAHTELSWILSTLTSLGELERMRQFKEKGYEKSYLQDLEKIFELFQKHRQEFERQGNEPVVKYYQNMISQIRNVVTHGMESKIEINVGLLNYPVLMAADILLYDAKFVPVGDDQDQHLELARTLARKFNAKFGKTFVEPQGLHTPTPRVMSLTDPEKKMSKSEPSGCLFIDDSPDEIKRKIARATTDSGSEIKYGPAKFGISNLLEIYSALLGDTIPTLEKKFAGKNYSQFKSSLAQLVADHFAGFRKKKKLLLAKPYTLSAALKSGSKRATKVANKKIDEVKEKIGLRLGLF